MKQLITLLAAVALLGQASFAATAPKKKTTVRTSTPKTETVTTRSGNGEVHTYSASKSAEFSAAVALGTLDGHFTFGPRFMVEFPTNLDGQNFKFGGETGFLYGTSSGVTYWSIPIMANGTYLFKNSSSVIKPYVGAAMGISIDHASVGVASGTQVHFAFLAKPGMNFGNDQKLFVELPIGTLFSGFALLPTFGMHF